MASKTTATSLALFFLLNLSLAIACETPHKSLPKPTPNTPTPTTPSTPSTPTPTPTTPSTPTPTTPSTPTPTAPSTPSNPTTPSTPTPTTPSTPTPTAPGTPSNPTTPTTPTTPSAPSPSPSSEACPRDALKLGVCANVLGLVKVQVGSPPTLPCCSLLQGLVDLEAAVCLCTAIKANVLGINLDIPLSLSLVLDACARNTPSGFQCS